MEPGVAAKPRRRRESHTPGWGGQTQTLLGPPAISQSGEVDFKNQFGKRHSLFCSINKRDTHTGYVPTEGVADVCSLFRGYASTHQNGAQPVQSQASAILEAGAGCGQEARAARGLLAKHWKQPKCPVTGDWANEPCQARRNPTEGRGRRVFCRGESSQYTERKKSDHRNT